MMRTRFSLVFLGFGLFLTGCGGEGSLPPDQLDRARNALQTALDAWKQGLKAHTLAAKSIEISDSDWQAGLRLVSYEVKSVEGKPGKNPHSWTVLSLETRQGKKLEREVLYDIRLRDKITIGRDPMN